jgi:hypothetical protein
MLDELISKSHGRAIGVRVLDEYGTIEQSGQQKGTLLGIDCTATVTFTSAPKGDTTCYGEDIGIAVTKDGDYITFKTILVGFTKEQTVHYRGARYYRTNSPKACAS